jgi:septal ring factor EnvC (AmiA/AmiB activator)
MSSKIITTVMVLAIVGPFAYIATADAVSIKHNLQEQNNHIQSLNTEYKKLDTELTKTQVAKQQTAQEVQQLEQQTIDATKERQQLEAQLGAN